MKIISEVKAVLIVIILQAIFCTLLFVGFLLDPLIGVWMFSIYFFIVSSFFMYRYALHKMIKS